LVVPSVLLIVLCFMCCCKILWSFLFYLFISHSEFISEYHYWTTRL